MRLALLAVLKKWKVPAAKKIFKNKIRVDAEYMKKLMWRVPGGDPRGKRVLPAVENICYGFLRLMHHK